MLGYQLPQLQQMMQQQGGMPQGMPGQGMGQGMQGMGGNMAPQMQFQPGQRGAFAGAPQMPSAFNGQGQMNGQQQQGGDMQSQMQPIMQMLAAQRQQQGAQGVQNPISQGGPITTNPTANAAQMGAGGAPGVNWNQQPGQVAMGPYSPQTMGGQAMAQMGPQDWQKMMLQNGGQANAGSWMQNLFGGG